MHTQAVEDYLKAIYKLADKEDKVTTSLLADFLNVTPASATGYAEKVKTDEPGGL